MHENTGLFGQKPVSAANSSSNVGFGSKNGGNSGFGTTQNGPSARPIFSFGQSSGSDNGNNVAAHNSTSGIFSSTTTGYGGGNSCKTTSGQDSAGRPHSAFSGFGFGNGQSGITDTATSSMDVNGPSGDKAHCAADPDSSTAAGHQFVSSGSCDKNIVSFPAATAHIETQASTFCFQEEETADEILNDGTPSNQIDQDVIEVLRRSKRRHVDNPDQLEPNHAEIYREFFDISDHGGNAVMNDDQEAKMEDHQVEPHFDFGAEVRVKGLDHIAGVAPLRIIEKGWKGRRLRSLDVVDNDETSFIQAGWFYRLDRIPDGLFVVDDSLLYFPEDQLELDLGDDETDDEEMEASTVDESDRGEDEAETDAAINHTGEELSIDEMLATAED